MRCHGRGHGGRNPPGRCRTCGAAPWGRSHSWVERVTSAGPGSQSEHQPQTLGRKTKNAASTDCPGAWPMRRLCRLSSSHRWLLLRVTMQKQSQHSDAPVFRAWGASNTRCVVQKGAEYLFVRLIGAAWARIWCGAQACVSTAGCRSRPNPQGCGRGRQQHAIGRDVGGLCTTGLAMMRRGYADGLDTLYKRGLPLGGCENVEHRSGRLEAVAVGGSFFTTSQSLAAF